MPQGIAWKLNRLRCMTPAEISHRVVKAAAMRVERWGLAPCIVPSPDLARRALPWVHANVRVDAEPYVEAAERVIAGRYDVFALEDVKLGNPPRWNRDPKTGIEAPLDFGKAIDYRDACKVGDCKYLWEPNRHLHLVTLAQAYALTREIRFALTLRRHLESWFEACPFRRGPNWSSSLEAGLRLVNWAFAWQLLGGTECVLFAGDEGRAFRDRWLESVYRHAEFIAGHLSLHSSANNHLIGEALGLYVAALAWPHWGRCARWRRTARAILEREALLQNAPDGVNREQAVSYQQFTFEMLLVALLAARANDAEFPAAFVERLGRMLEFLASIIDAGGNVPMIGDADDAHVVRLDPRPDFDRYASSLATGAVLFKRADFKAKARGLDDKTRWLLGPEAELRFHSLREASRALPVRRKFPEGGYYILGTDFETPREIRVVADVGPLGYREIAAHGHADALSFTLSVAGIEFFVDPGTFAYHTEGAWRAYFRGTSAHNTVRIDQLDQSEPGGNFMWLAKARAERIGWSSTAERDCLEGEHDGYRRLADPVSHRRRIVLDKRARSIEIVDMLDMRGEHEVEIFLHCAEETMATPAGDALLLSRGGRSIRLRGPQGMPLVIHVGSVAPIAGWVSRRFDRKVAAPTLVWRGRLEGPQVLKTRIDC